MFSIFFNKDDISQKLIEAGANNDVQDKDGIYLVINH